MSGDAAENRPCKGLRRDPGSAQNDVWLISSIRQTLTCVVANDYHCSDGKWKGEVTSQEHTPTFDVRPFAGHVASMGFAGTYTDEGAEFEATALVGKRSLRLRTVFRLLIADE